MTVKFFVPSDNVGDDLDGVVQAAANRKLLPPFHPTLIKIVVSFSKSILLDRESRNYPELVVLANFFRAANIERLRSLLPQDSESVCFGRGLVFHIAPSNVDSVFLYSSLLSLLCGNINVVRVSQNSGSQLNFVLAKLNAVIKESAIEVFFYVLTYEHSDEITMRISSLCHMRVVWGGDETVRKIRSLPLRSTAIEMCFPDRFSAAMLNAEAVISLDFAGLNDLCERFYNDSIWFAQQACSSPRLVAWVGNLDSCAVARERFWQVFSELLTHKTYENSSGMSMDRFVTACLIATDALHKETSALAFPTRILLEGQSLAGLKKYHCGNGLFYEQYFQSLVDFLSTLSDQEQTLSIYGYSSVEIKESLGELPMRSVDRITNIGHALDFGVIWDGTNLLRLFTRQIHLQL